MKYLLFLPLFSFSQIKILSVYPPTACAGDTVQMCLKLNFDTSAVISACFYVSGPALQSICLNDRKSLYLLPKCDKGHLFKFKIDANYPPGRAKIMSLGSVCFINIINCAERLENH